MIVKLSNLLIKISIKMQTCRRWGLGFHSYLHSQLAIFFFTHEEILGKTIDGNSYRNYNYSYYVEVTYMNGETRKIP